MHKIHQHKSTRDINIIALIGTLGITALMILIFSFTTSPFAVGFYEDYQGVYSASAEIIGRGWWNGKVPYRDLCGNSGPLYYLIQSLGWGIYQSIGIVIFQIIGLWVTGYFTFKVCRKFSDRKKTILMTCFLVFPVIALYGAGNSEEEFAIPLVIVLLYIMLKNISLKELSKSARMHSFVIGVLFASICMIQWRTAIGIFLSMITYFFFLFKDSEEKIKNKATNICFVFIGTICIIGPVFLYFIVENSFIFMIKDYIAIQVKLLQQGMDTWNEIIRKLIKIIPMIIVLIGVLILGEKKFQRERIIVIIGSVGTILPLIGGDGSWHYYSIMIPWLWVGIALIGYEKCKLIQLAYSGISIISIGVILFIPFVRMEQKLISVYKDKEYKRNNLAATQWFEDYIKSEEDTPLVIDVSPGFYLSTGYEPSYRLFAYQSKLAKIDDEYYGNEIRAIFDSERYSYVLLGASGFISEQYGNYKLSEWFGIYRSEALYVLNKDGVLESHIHDNDE